MKINIHALPNNFTIHPDKAKEIFEYISNDMQEDPYSDEATYYFLLNFYVKELLVEKTEFDFVLDICNLGTTSYKYIFDQFLNIFPEVLTSLNTGADFTLDLIEQGWDNYYHFTVKDYLYSIKAVSIFGSDVGEIEFVKVDEVKRIFNTIKNTFLNVMKYHFNDDFYHIYEKYLDVNSYDID